MRKQLKKFLRQPARVKSPELVDPKGRRLIGRTFKHQPIWAPKGHSLLLSANGGGKTTCGALVWLFSLLASDPTKAIAVFDSKDGELAWQCADMIAAQGRKVAILDDMGVFPADKRTERQSNRKQSVTRTPARRM